jgi:hypothetical protein
VLKFLKDNASSGPHGPASVAQGLQRSSGAVANCLDRLKTTKKVRQIGDKPRRYKIGIGSTRTPSGSARYASGARRDAYASTSQGFKTHTAQPDHSSSQPPITGSRPEPGRDQAPRPEHELKSAHNRRLAGRRDDAPGPAPGGKVPMQKQSTSRWVG